MRSPTYKKPVQLQRLGTGETCEKNEDCSSMNCASVECCPSCNFPDNPDNPQCRKEKECKPKPSATGAIAGTIILYFLLFMCGGTLGVLIYKMSK